MKKHYINSNTSEHTESATIAMMWYRTGNTVQVNTFSEKGLVKVVHVQGKTKPYTMNENKAHCKAIADDLQDYADGLVYRCPECGELITVDSDWSGVAYKCPGCHTIHDGNDLEIQDMADYFDDCYDMAFTIGSDMQYRGVRLMVACGGPNIYVDTMTRQVELYWWSDSARYRITSDVVEAIDTYFEDYYICCR